MKSTHRFLFLAALSLVVVSLLVFAGDRFLGEGITGAGSRGTLAAIGAYFLAYFGFDSLFERLILNKRMQEIRGGFISSDANRRKRKVEQHALKQSGGWLHSMMERAQSLLKLDRSGLHGIRQRLMAAGYHSDQAILVYVFVKSFGTGLASLVGLGISLLFFQDLTTHLGFFCVSAAVVYYGTNLIIRSKTKKRHLKAEEEFPDVLDLIVIYTEAGNAVYQALPRAAEKAHNRYPVVSAELTILERELRLLPDRKQAYDNFIQRIGIELAKRFVIIIQQSETAGAAVSEALQQLSVDSRKERMLLAERRAAKIPVIINIPVVLFIIPSLMLIVLGPVGIKIFQTLMNSGI